MSPLLRADGQGGTIRAWLHQENGGWRGLVDVLPAAGPVIYIGEVAGRRGPVRMETERLMELAARGPEEESDGAL